MRSRALPLRASLLLGLLAALAFSSAAHAATLPLLGEVNPEPAGAPAEVAGARGAAAAVAAQPAAGPQSAAGVQAVTEAAKQATSLIVPSAAPPASSPKAAGATTSALSAGASGAVKSLVHAAGAGTSIRTVTRSAEAAVGAAADSLAQVQGPAGTGALGRGAQLVSGAARRAGALLEAPAHTLTGALGTESAAAARVLGPVTRSARSQTAARSAEQRLFAAFGGGRGAGPPSVGGALVLLGSSAAPLAALSQAPHAPGGAGLALVCPLGSGEAGAAGCSLLSAAAGADGMSAAALPAAAASGASRAPPAGFGARSRTQHAEPFGGAPPGSPIESLLSGTGAAAGAAGGSVAIALTLALLLLGLPMLKRMLPLGERRAAAFAFALIPERPG